MKKGKEGQASQNTNNLASVAPLIYQVLEDYQVSKIYLAEKLYSKEWSSEKDIRQKLTMRLRNKLNGTGNIEKWELKQIQNILLEMSEKFAENVKQSIINIERKEKLVKLLLNSEKVDTDMLDRLLENI